MRSNARRVALEAAFHAPDSRAFGCPEEHPKPQGADIGEATFGMSVKPPRRDEARCGRAKTSKRWSCGEVASAKALQHRSGDRLLPGTSAKGTRRRYKDEGTPSRRGARDSLGEVPGPKPRSKASGGEGPKARLRPTCRASCNPLNGCRLNVT